MSNGKTLSENTVELTQEEYDALPDTKLTDGVNYFITDGEGGGGGTSITLDTTLTVEGQAADAKAVGDALTGVNKKINVVFSENSDYIQVITSTGEVVNVHKVGLTSFNLLELTADKWETAPTYNSDGSITFTCKASSGATTKKTWLLNGPFDLSGYNRVRFTGISQYKTSSLGSGYSKTTRIMIINADTDEEVTRYSPAPSTSGYGFDEVVELPDLTNISCRISVYLQAGNNNGKDLTTTLQFTTITFYKEVE
jgi:hypothetical protein